MRVRRAGAFVAVLLGVAMVAGACGSSGSSKPSATGSVASQLVFGGPPECETRVTCLLGFEQVYGLHFKSFKALDAGGPLTKTALKNGDIQVARIFTSDEAIQINNFVVLDDDKHFQLAGNIVPVIRTGKATSDVKSVLNKVSKALTTDDLMTLNKSMDIDKQEPSDVAAGFAKSKGLAGTASGGSKGSITIGSANFSENEMLADLYADALKGAGYSVTVKANLGSREVVEPALESGQIDLVPEYAGNYLSFLDTSVGALALDQTVSKLQADANKKGLTVLDASSATDADATAVTKATADKYHLSKISDLGKKA
jgi:glycine betaine/choline ABC-type transport system substrate-binding protein